MKRNLKNPLLISLTLSVFLHLTVVGSLSFLKVSPSNEHPQVVEVDFIPPEEINIQEPQKILAELQQEELKKRQIVEQDDRLANTEIPKDDYFLSKHNQHIEHQTQALNHGDYQNGAARTPQDKVEKISQNQQSNKNLKTKNQNERQAKNSHKQQSELASFKQEVPSSTSLQPKFDWNPVSASELSAANEKQDENKNVQSQTNDYLKNVDKGLETMLNTREFVYYTYYSRIRTQLRYHWETRIRDKIRAIFRQGRGLASAQDRITKVIITLDAKGILVNVQVISESGIRDLDDAAIEAFKAAAPFPNPPQGIIDQDGRIRIHWDFVLEA